MNKIVLISLIFSILINGGGISQTLPVNQTFNSDSQINPFGGRTDFSRLTFNGSVNLQTDTSLVRLIVVDQLSGNEYLLFEAYPLINVQKQFSVVDKTEELYALDDLQPVMLKIQLVAASVTITSIGYTTTKYSNAAQLNETHRLSAIQSKIDNINSSIASNHLWWYAGNGMYGVLAHQMKKQFYSEKYNLKGYEYYEYGIYSNLVFKIEEPISNYPANYDWRDKHDARNQNSPYWDGNPDVHNWGGDFGVLVEKNGWMTSVKSQIPWGHCPNGCYLFAPLAQIEAVANLYFNQHKDFNLSEQAAMCCDADNSSHCYLGGDMSIVLKYAKDSGVVNESCFPWLDSVTACNKCSIPNYKLKIPWYNQQNFMAFNNMESIKQILINEGPICMSYDGHVMVLVGYSKANEGDTIHKRRGYEPDIIVQPGDPLIGKTYWILKNSRSPYSNDEGYVREFYDSWCGINRIQTPIIEMINDTCSVVCRDADGDGYYNWGIGSKPANCPNCPDEEDSDDSNPIYGPYDENFSPTINCEFVSGTKGDITVDRNLIWFDKSFVSSNITVSNNKTLEIRKDMVYLSISGDITVNSGATLILNGSKIYGQCYPWNGNITIAPGAKLILKNGAEINFAGSGRLNIQKDASNSGTVEVYDNSVINMSGNQNIIVLNGSLYLKDNCNLSINGNGYFHFNGSLNIGTNCTFSMEGENREQLMLKISKDIFPAKFTEFTLRKGKVYFETTNGQIKLDQAGTAVTAENVLFTGLSTQKYNNALYVVNPSQMNVSECIFEHVKTAVNIQNLATNPAVNFSSCSFSDFRTGVSVNGGAITFSGCSFASGTTGLSAINMANASSISSGSFTGLTTGINFKGLTSSSLAVSYTSSTGNTDGLVAEGPVPVTANCSNFGANTNAGVYLKSNASLTADNCTFDNSKYPVLAYQAKTFDLHNGYNTLKCSSGGLAMSGSFCATFSLTVDAFRNRWNSLGIAPRQTTDYNLKDCSTTPRTITLRDLYPQNSYTECDVPGGLMGAQAFAATSSGFPTELENKINEAASLMEIGNPQGNDQLAFEKLHKIVTTPKYYQTENQGALADKAYTYLRQTLGNLANHQPAVLEVHATKTLQAAQFVQSKNPGNYRVKFNTHIDRAHVKLLEGKFGQAIQILNQMQSWTLEADEPFRAKELCLAQQMKALAEGTLTTDDPEALMLECNCYEPSSEGSAAAENGDNNSGNNMLAINVLPNPTTGNATIEILLPENSAGAVLTIHDQMGMLKQQFTLQAGQNSLTTGKAILGTGVFNLGVFLNGTKIGEGRLSVND